MKFNVIDEHFYFCDITNNELPTWIEVNRKKHYEIMNDFKFYFAWTKKGKMGCIRNCEFVD